MIGEVQFTSLQIPVTAVKMHLISPWCIISSQEVNSEGSDSHFFPLEFGFQGVRQLSCPPPLNMTQMCMSNFFRTEVRRQVYWLDAT